MVPDTHEHHPSHVHSHSNHHLSLNPFRSGGTNGSPARQLISNVPFPAQNRYSFLSFLPLPPLPDSSPMLTLLPEIPPRRGKKLRKPSTTHAPPVLPPLSFVEDRNLDIDFEHISHDVQPPSLASLRQQSLTRILPFQQDTYPLDYETPVQLSPHGGKMIGDRCNPSVPLTQIVSSSSGAAVTDYPAAPVAAISQISSPFALGVPVRSHSDYGRNFSTSLTTKGSNLIRKLSGRSPRPYLDAGSSYTMTADSKLLGTTHDPTSSGSPRRWSWWRTMAEHNGKDELSVKTPPLHSEPIHRKPHEAEKAYKTRPPSAEKVSRPSSITVSGTSDMSISATFNPRYPRSRPKFTLEANDSEADLISQSRTARTHYANYSQSCPPSRTHSVDSPHSPSLFLQDERQLPRRRWTFAMAVTDKEVTDEALVEVLAGIRLKRDLTGSEDSGDNVWDADLILFGLQEEPQLDHDTHLSQTSADHSHTSSLPPIPHTLQRHNSVSIVGSRPSQPWRTAQRLLFTCRELVRTERHYLASLQMLLASNTETAPPPLMLKYAEELARVSELYLGQMEGNPSAWGVAAAFLGAEETIEGALVRWCGSVGMWFKDGGYETELESKFSMRNRRFSKAIKLGGGSSDETHEYDEAISGPLKKVNSWRRSMSSIPDLSASIYTARKKEKHFAPLTSISSTGHERQQRPSQARKPPVRDLAILPTQRIMRYVLLYRDLFDHTPSTSPASPLMKRAVDATLKLAQKCDRAQNNSAFILGSPAVLTKSPSSGSGNPTCDPVQPLSAS